MEGEVTHVCDCGRFFAGEGPLRFHKRTCQPGKRRLGGALAKAKEIWQSRKKPRLAQAVVALGSTSSQPPDAPLTENVSVTEAPELEVKNVNRPEVAHCNTISIPSYH